VSGPRIHDEDARRRAATDFATNLVVEAGAGTGKTSLLVERVLTAVGADAAPLERIAAITFTEKAAGEMRLRVARGLDRLRQLALGEVQRDAQREADRAFAWLVDVARLPGPEIAARALRGMEALDRAVVSTIHAFSSELLRAHPLEAGVDPDFLVDEGQHAESLRREAWERFLVTELGPAAPRAELWSELLGDVTLAELEGLGGALASFGIPERLLHAPFALPDARELLRGEIERLIGGIAELLERQQGLPRVPLDYFEGMLRSLRALRDGGVGAFREAVSPDLAGRIESGSHPRKPPANFRGVPPERLVELSKQSRNLARILLGADDRLMLRALEAVAPFALTFREDYLLQGLASFDGLLGLARDLLRDHPAIRRSLKQRYRLLLVDEFQDTDPVQYEIVLFLAEDPGSETDNPWAARLAPGKLFVVGDAKQSVYRFRGADYAAYRRAVDRIVEQGGTRLDLTTNFRSVPGILAPVNALFSDAAGTWRESPYQPGYVAIRPGRLDSGPARIAGAGPTGPAGTRPADAPALFAAGAKPEDAAAPRVELWTVDPGRGAGAEERREAEGRAIAAEIERLVESGGVGYRRITIVMRALTRLSLYLRPLRERGIPFVVDGGREFLRRPEVAQLLATLRTLAQPADEPALLAFLRSPAGAVPDTLLAAYAAAGKRWDWRSEIDRQAFPELARAFGLLRALADETRQLPADATIRRVLERTQQLPLGGAAFEGPQRVANLRKLAASAGELARDGRLSLEEVVEALREGRMADIETDRPLADDAADAVRITSIHRMKGLENDWVFFPDLARGDLRGRDRGVGVRLVRLEDGRAALALRTKSCCSSSQAWVELENHEHEKTEETRVFYVALTRARERLVVIAGPARSESEWVKALAPWGYDVERCPADGAILAGGTVLHRRLAVGTRPPRHAEVVDAQVSAAVARHEEAMLRLRAAAHPPIDAPSGMHEERGSARGTPQAAASRGGARDVAQAAGVVLHRLLEVAPHDAPEAMRRRLDGLCRETAAARGCDPRRLAHEAREILDSFLASPLAAELREADAIGRELPVLVRRDDGRVFHGSIDLLHRRGDGQVVVVDYKTDRDADDAALQERYGDQLAIYADAVRAALDLDRRPPAELWLLRSGRRVAVPL